MKTRAVRHPLLSLLLLALLGGCAGLRSSRAGESRFASLPGVGVFVNSQFADAYAAPRELRPPQLHARLVARLEEARVPVIRRAGGQEGYAGVDGSYQLELVPFELGPDDHAVWVRVSLGELVRPRRGSTLPLLVSTWTRTGTVRLRGGDTAPLWREIDRLTREFAREYRAANPAAR